MRIPERRLSELAESVRDFERGEEALTEFWRTWRMCLDNSRENNRHFDRERCYPVRAKQPRVRSFQAPVTRSTSPGQRRLMQRFWKLHQTRGRGGCLGFPLRRCMSQVY